jgi:hypothetical protein
MSGILCAKENAMTSRAFRSCALIAALALAAAAPALAAEPEKAPPSAPSAEQRQKMAEAHQRMADCLKSSRPISECHAEMKQSCQEAHGEGGCPMMEHGHGHGAGMGGPPKK